MIVQASCGCRYDDDETAPCPSCGKCPDCCEGDCQGEETEFCEGCEDCDGEGGHEKIGGSFW